MWKECKDKLNPKETFTKKGTIFFIPRKGFSHFRQGLQNPGLKEISGFPSSPIYSVRNLRSTALAVKILVKIMVKITVKITIKILVKILVKVRVKITVKIMVKITVKLC